MPRARLSASYLLCHVCPCCLFCTCPPPRLLSTRSPGDALIGLPKPRRDSFVSTPREAPEQCCFYTDEENGLLHLKCSNSVQFRSLSESFLKSPVSLWPFHLLPYSSQRPSTATILFCLPFTSTSCQPPPPRSPDRNLKKSVCVRACVCACARVGGISSTKAEHLQA